MNAPPLTSAQTWSRASIWLLLTIAIPLFAWLFMQGAIQQRVGAGLRPLAALALPAVVLAWATLIGLFMPACGANVRWPSALSIGGILALTILPLLALGVWMQTITTHTAMWTQAALVIAAWIWATLGHLSARWLPTMIAGHAVATIGVVIAAATWSVRGQWLDWLAL